MEVAIGANVHDEVVAVEAAAEVAEEFVVFGAGAEGGVEDLLAEGGGGGGGPFIEGAEGPGSDGVEERGGDFGGVSVGLNRSTSVSGVGAAGRFWAAQRRRSAVDWRRCSSGSQYLARVGARGSVCASSQRQAGRAGGGDFGADGADLGVGGGFETADLFSSVRMLVTWPTLVGTAQKRR
jgi:hypothetical protein